MANGPLCGLGAFIVAASLAACDAPHDSPSASSGQPAASGILTLQSVPLKAGAGAGVAPGQIAVVQYTGWLYEASAPDYKGRQFDSSRNSGKPFRFPLGTGSVIKGWDQGVAGMKVGESRRLIIPADLAYGDAGAGGVIPPGATLVFDIDLVGIE
jgi:FKBP-type peptidyl-prolyl cis-trans isomerase FkpA